ncbi:hypothetical protein BZA70DRAFT_117069 [Myxozyma melibiosi]|uniref:Superkiller protein 3 n=1 Tax=Myxozyma melibiosi TaxID=54550 RepID=A0ABR1FAI6_9ASCO
MSALKKSLVAAKQAVEQKDFKTGRDNCTQALAIDPNSYNALILLGYCQNELRDRGAAIEAYRKAVDLNPRAAMAYQGLLTVYEADRKVSEYIDTTLILADIYRELDDINRCTSLMNKTQSFVAEKGSKKDKIKMLKAILPGTPVYEYLEGRLPHPASTLQKLTEMLETEERQTIEGSVSKQRNKLGVNINTMTRKIKREVYEASELEKYYDLLLNWSDDDQTRRQVEGKLLTFLYNKLLVLQPKDRQQTKLQLYKMATEMVVLHSPIELAWSITLDWNDCRDLSELDENLLREYINNFPDTGLSKVIQAFLKSDISPFHRATEAETDGDDGESDVESVTVMEEHWSDEELLEKFTEGYEMNPNSPLANRILGMYYLHIGEYENAVELSISGLKVLQKVVKDFSRNLKKCRDAISVTLGTAYIYYQAPRHFDEALHIFDEILSDMPDHSQALIGKALIFEEQCQVTEARDILQSILDKDPKNVVALSEISWCKILLGQHEEGRAGLEKCLSLLTRDDPSSENMKAKIWWRIGKSMWDERSDLRSDRSRSYNAFVTSLKFNPNYAPSYTSLGVFFADIAGETERAGKCFHKAFELDATEAEAAKRLTETFANERDWELVEVIASRFAEAEKKRSVPGKEASWPYRVLGVAYLQSQDLVKAIQSFQTALRSDSSDTHSWTGLGEAYAASGRYIAASKSFVRASTVDPDNWYAQFLLGMVHRQIQDFDEAKTLFNSVLSERPSEFVVLSHLCEALVASAQHNVARHYYGDAVSDAVEALEVALTISKTRTDSFNMWKNAGDAIAIFFQVKAMADKFPTETVTSLILSAHPEFNAEMQRIDEIDGVSLKNIGKLDNIDILQTVTFYHCLAYKMGLLETYQTMKSRAVGWFNIACAELRIFQKMGMDEHYESAAIECFKNAIKLEPKNAQFWNAYGITTARQYPLISQHAFIRSLIIDNKQVVAWANLGTMYLIKGDYELANLAFTRAQSADPDYMISWLGQGLIAKAVGEEAEANDLFEHSFTICSGADVSKLAHLLYAASAFAQMTKSSTRALTPINVELAVFTLEKVLLLDPEYVPAAQYKALVLERKGDYSRAIATLTDACSRLEQLYEDSESPEELREFTNAKAQLARLYLAHKDFSESLEASLFVVDLSEGDDNLRLSRLSAEITAGLAYYYSNQSDEALKMFGMAGSDSNDDLDISVMLAQVLYSLGGENREKASDLLFKNIEQDSQHLKSITLLGTIGLVDGSEDIVDAIEAELTDFDIDQQLNSVSDRSIEILMSALEGSKSKDHKPTVRPWLQSAILKPSDPKIWNHIDRKTALETAMLEKSVKARELSDEFVAAGSFANSIKAIFISPGNEKAWGNLASLTEEFSKRPPPAVKGGNALEEDIIKGVGEMKVGA